MIEFIWRSLTFYCKYEEFKLNWSWNFFWN